MKDSVRKAIFANASSKSKMLSHHFGSSDIDSRGSNFVINFGEKGYEGRLVKSLRVLIICILSTLYSLP